MLRRFALSRLAPGALGLGSFACVAVHGAGLLLVPALAPLCGAGPARRLLGMLTEPALLALAATGVPPGLAVAAVAAAAALGVGWPAALASARLRGRAGAIRAACHGSPGCASRSGGR